MLIFRILKGDIEHFKRIDIFILNNFKVHSATSETL